jgi:hypothetical protein
MDFTSALRRALWRKVGEGKPFANRKRMADALDIDPSQLNRFMDGERGLSSDTLGRLLDGLGARLAWPDEPASGGQDADRGKAPSEPGDPPRFNAGDFLAVPLAPQPLSDVPERFSDNEIPGWVLVPKQHESVRFRPDLMALVIAKGDMSMAPALHPGDIILVDRAEKSPDPAGKLMLVRTPGQGCQVRRVCARPEGDDLELLFYSDNPREFPPRVQRLRQDLDGDIDRAVVGRVVWAWSDMTRK